jgi:hypothetical protein
VHQMTRCGSQRGQPIGTRQGARRIVGGLDRMNVVMICAEVTRMFLQYCLERRHYLQPYRSSASRRRSIAATDADPSVTLRRVLVRRHHLDIDVPRHASHRRTPGRAPESPHRHRHSDMPLAGEILRVPKTQFSQEEGFGAESPLPTGLRPPITSIPSGVSVTGPSVLCLSHPVPVRKRGCISDVGGTRDTNLQARAWRRDGI